MKVLFSAIALVLAGTTTSASAEEQSRVVERSVKSVPNKDTQIGVYITCSPTAHRGRYRRFDWSVHPLRERSWSRAGR